MSGAALRVRDVVWVREAAAGGVPVDPTRKKGVASVGADGLPRVREQQAAVTREEPRPARTAGRSAVRIPDASLGFYRRYTEVFLRRYMQLSLRMGQVPSVLGSCMFRGRVSSRPTRTFEDTVALVLDVEKCMRKLTAEDREVIARVALQEYTQEEAAELLGMSHRTLVRRYADAMDALTRILLDVELLEVESLYPGQ